MRRGLAYAFRQMSRHPRLAATIVLPLAVALGLSTAVATIADALLIKKLPYPDAGRLVRIDGVFTRLPLRVTESGLELTAPLSAPEISSAHSLSAAGMYSVAGLNAGDDHPLRLHAAAVTPGFFDVLQVSPQLGHVFTDRDLAASGRVVISAHLWHAYFQSDANVAGRVLRLNGRPFVVTAVMPDEFDFPERTDAWIPSGSDAQVASQVAVPELIGRLRTGTTIASARQELLQIVSRGTLTRQDPDRPTLRVAGLQDALVAPLRSALWFVVCAAFLLLLVAALNASNLMVARVCDRQREFAVRRAIGATTLSLLSPIACESVLLVIVAAVCAAPVAVGTLGGVRTMLDPAVVPLTALTPTARSLWILLLLSGISLSVLGFVPVLAAVSHARTVSLHATSTSAPPKRRVTAAVVIAQVASAVIVLACAATIVGTLQRLQSVDLGARHDRAVIAEFTLPAAAYGGSARHRLFFDRLRDELQANPGVSDVGLTNYLPGTDVITPSIPLRLDGVVPAGDTINVLRLAASPGYFSALGIDIVAGRSILEADDGSSTPVVVVSTACVRAVGLSPETAIGRRINVGLDGTDWATIVGVVRDVRMRGPESETTAALYVPFGQISVGPTAFVVVQGTATRGMLVDEIRAAMSRLDRSLPIYNVREFGDIRAEYLATRRFVMTMVSIFGVIVFALACFGLNAIMAYMVRRRTREIGVRLAIGASPFVVRYTVLRAAAGYAASGIAVALIALPLVENALAATVPGIVPPGSVKVACIAAVVLMVGTFSAWLPATRAARIDPMVALRADM
jgi:predicted permease